MSVADDRSYVFPDPPPPLVPRPAVKCFDMRGTRVIVGLPGAGWQYDLRADDPVMRKGQLVVPVLAEGDYYRAQDENTEALAALYPADQVWVETRAESHEDATVGRHLFERLVDVDQPQPRRPVPASEVHGLTGRRVWHWVGGRFAEDVRCVSEAYENDDGDIGVRLCGEREWYRWTRTGTMPATSEALIHLVWVQC